MSRITGFLLILLLKKDKM